MNINANLLKAIDASIQAGQTILEVYRSDFSVEYKTDSSPLTLADSRSHEVIVKHLSESDIPMLSEEAHVVPESELLSLYGKRRKDYEIFMGFDPGSTSAFAVLLVAIHKYNKSILILDEHYETDKAEMSTRPMWTEAMRILNKWNIRIDDVRFIYDYAAAWFANEVNDKFGIGLEPCFKDIGRDKEKRLSLIKDCLLLEGCVKFNAENVNQGAKYLFWEMSNYRTDEKHKIPKENDHAIDTLRYILSNAHYDEAPTSPISRDPDDMRRGFTFEQDRYDSIINDPMERFKEDFYE